MTDDDAKPGSHGRPFGCFYFEEDHARAAAHVRKTKPEVFEWIEAYPEGLPDDVNMHQLLWRTAKEVLPKASLIDLSQVALLLRLAADPPDEFEKKFLEAKARLRKKWRRTWRH
jgi:hypothetical protein